MPTAVQGPDFDLGANIRRVRTKAGLTQKELAERVGVATNTISDWENGRREPSVRQIVMIAKACNVELGELFQPHQAGVESCEVAPAPASTAHEVPQQSTQQSGVAGSRIDQKVVFVSILDRFLDKTQEQDVMFLLPGYIVHGTVARALDHGSDGGNVEPSAVAASIVQQQRELAAEHNLDLTGSGEAIVLDDAFIIPMGSKVRYRVPFCVLFTDHILAITAGHKDELIRAAEAYG